MFVNILSLKLLYQTRQQWIYVVFAIILGILIYEGLFVLLPLLAFFYFRFSKKYWIFLLVFIASIVSLHLASRDPLTPFLMDENAVYTANIIQIHRRRDDSQTAIVDIEGKRVFMTFRNLYPPLAPGQIVEIYGQLTEPTSPTIPHRFNFKAFLQNLNIHLTINTSTLTVIETSFSIWRLQHDIANWIRNRFPPLTSSYLQSFFLGLRDDMDEEMMDIYSNLGILHVFAISGVHVTLLTGIIRDSLKRIGLLDLIVDTVIIIFCITFIFLAGGSVSIIRACAMAIIAIINRRLKFGLSSFDIFAIVFIANFAINPLIIYQRGFQLSYWIAFILICSKPVLHELTPVRAHLTIVFLARMASIPIIATTGNEINVTSYIANLVLVPFFMQIIIPTLLLTLFLPFLAPLTEILLQVFEYFNEFLQPFLNTNISFGNISLPIIVLLMTLLLANCYFYEKHKKLYVRLALIGLYIFVLETNRLWQPYTAITFLDVGQGDATIIRSPYQSCTIVIDTGGNVSRIHSANPSIFNSTLKPYLLGNGVRNIDFLILTHEHYDHIAEAIPLMNNFNIQNLILSSAEHGHQMQEITQTAKSLNIPIHIAQPLDSFTCGNQVYTFIHDEIGNLDVNEDSLVMTVEIDGFNVLLTGDIGHVTEQAILNNNHLTQIHAYQVAHHGSRHSNSLEFMDALNISYAIVQVGYRNLYGHPHAELFNVVNTLQIPLLNNVEHGTIQFKLYNENNYQIYLWPP